MAIVVEDGTAKIDANSYNAISDIDTFASDQNLDDSEWADLEAAAKEAALLNATNDLEARWAGLWVGDRKTKDQALAWPRSWAYDEDGYLLDDDVVPPRVIKAHAFLTIDYANDRVNLDRATPQEVEEVNVGSIGVKFAEGSGASNETFVDNLLYPLTSGVGVLERG